MIICGLELYLEVCLESEVLLGNLALSSCQFHLKQFYHCNTPLRFVCLLFLHCQKNNTNLSNVKGILFLSVVDSPQERGSLRNRRMSD